MNKQRIAVELLKVAKNLVLAKSYGHTLWITDKGKVIDLGNSGTHADWIYLNWNKYYPEDEEVTIKNIFKLPYEKGWLQVRNHALSSFGSSFKVFGQKRYIKKRGKLIEDIIVDGMDKANSTDMWVDISYKHQHRDSYRLPEDWDLLERVL